MSAGLVNLKILLPQECGEMSAEELDCILTHELTHLKKHDLLVKLLTRLICCVMWWNPCTYLLRRDLDNALEYKCDLSATRSMGEEERVVYLQTLLNTLKRMKRDGSTPALCAGLFESSNAEVVKRRFHLVSNQDTHRKKWPAVVFTIAALALFLTSYSFVLQPASEPPPEDLIGEIVILPENSYILASSDSTYHLIHNGENFGKIAPERLQDRPYCLLNIQNVICEGAGLTGERAD